MSGTRILLHPFKEGVRGILTQYFHDSIVKNFVLEFEANIFNRDLANIRNQLKDQNYVLEVRYRNPDGHIEYICDVASWLSKKQTTATLLRKITDAYKIGKIGKDWTNEGGELKISPIIEKGAYETPNDLITRDTPSRRRINRGRKGTS